MDKSIEQLSQDLALAGYAKSTCGKYLKTAQRLRERFGRPIVEITRAELRTYAEETFACGLGTSSVTLVICALRFLYRRTLGRADLVSFLSLPKRYKPLPTVLSLAEVGALLDALRDPTYRGIAMVMYGAGLRISEALALEVGDIDGARGVLRVRHGKGNKAREAKLSPALYQWLRDYWSKLRPPAPYLFARRRSGKPPSPPSVCAAVRRAAKDVGLRQRVTPHTLRHSFATHLLEEGTDIRVVAGLLGHESLKSTMHYARVTEKLVRGAPSPLDLLLPQGRRR